MSKPRSRGNRRKTAVPAPAQRIPAVYQWLLLFAGLAVIAIVAVRLLSDPTPEKGTESKPDTAAARDDNRVKIPAILHPVAPGDEEYKTARARLYPTEGYKMFDSPRDLPVRELLPKTAKWTAAEKGKLDEAIALLTRVVGETHEAVRAIPTEKNKGNGTVVKEVLPIDVPFGFGKEDPTFVDSLWNVSEGTVHLTRRIVTTSSVLTASQLFFSASRAVRTPNVAAARFVDQAELDAACNIKLAQFHVTFRDYLEREKPEGWKEQLVELQVMHDNLLSHQSKLPGVMIVGGKR